MILTSQMPPFALSERISFRPEQEEDLAFLCRLYASTRADEMALTGWSEAQKDAFLRMQFRLQTTHYRQHYSDASFQIILLDQASVGRIYVHYGRGEIRLMDIALLPEFRGAGIGAYILKNLLQEAVRMKTSITLHVERFNRALHLYQQLGFQVIEDQGVNLYMEYRPV